MEFETAVDPRFEQAAALAALYTDTGIVCALDSREASLTGQGTCIQAARPK